MRLGPYLEQRVNERRRSRTGEEHQCAEQKHDDHDRREPPFLVVGHEIDELGEQASVPAFRRLGK